MKKKYIFRSHAGAAISMIFGSVQFDCKSCSKIGLLYQPALLNHCFSEVLELHINFIKLRTVQIYIVTDTHQNIPWHTTNL